MMHRDVGCAMLEVFHRITALDHQVTNQPVGLHDHALRVVDESTLQRAPFFAEARRISRG